MSLPTHYMPLTHLFVTSETTPKLKLDVVIYVEEGKKVQLNDGFPKIYGKKALLNYSSAVDSGKTEDYYYHEQLDINWDPNLLAVRTTVRNLSAEHFVENSTDKAEPYYG